MTSNLKKICVALALCLATASAQSTTMSQRDCSWNHPGMNPYKGSVEDAVNLYFDIPKDVRTVLKQRILAKQPDELVSITKYAVLGKSYYSPTITDMHFGPNLVCNSIERTRWPENMVQPADMYCEGRYCIIVPRICGNISRIERTDRLVELPRKVVEPPEYGTNVPRKLPHGEVPEPGSIALMLLGMGGLMGVRKGARK